MLWIKEVEMVESMGELKSSRSVAGKNFHNFEMLDAQMASVVNKIIQKLPLQEAGQSRGAESRVDSNEEDRSPSWSTTIFEWLVLMIPFYSWRECSGIRYKMGWSSAINDQDALRWCLGNSVQIENRWVWSTQNRIGIVRHIINHKNIDAQFSEIEDDGEEKHRSQTSTANFWRQTWENRNRCMVKSHTREWAVLKEVQVFVTSGKQKKGSVRRETYAVSGMKVTIMQCRHPKLHHPLSHNLQKH